MKGVNEWLKKLERMEKEFPEYADRALTDEANLVLADVKEMTPWDKGLLRGAWKKETTGVLERTIFNLTPYASHVEFGHRVVNRNGKAVRTTIFDGKTNSKLNTVKTVKGRYMLYRAMKASDKRFPKALNTIIRKLFG